MSSYAVPFGIPQKKNQQYRLGNLLYSPRVTGLPSVSIPAAGPTPPPAHPLNLQPTLPSAPNLTAVNPIGQSLPVNPNLGPMIATAYGGGARVGAAGAGGGGATNLDHSAIYDLALQTDPMYARAQALAAAERKTSASGFLAQMKQQLLGYGSTDYAHKVLDPLQKELSGYMGNTDLGLDKFYSAISQNPDTSFSTLGVLNKQTPELFNNMKENVNRSNLFFSGHGAKALSDQTYANQKAYSDADQAIQSTIMNDRSMYLSTLAGIDQQLASAAESAYMRALNEAYMYNLNPGGDGPGAGGGSANPYINYGQGTVTGTGNNLGYHSIPLAKQNLGYGTAGHPWTAGL